MTFMKRYALGRAFSIHSIIGLVNLESMHALLLYKDMIALVSNYFAMFD